MDKDQSLDRERELERLLGQANLHRLRDQVLEAENTCRKALEIAREDVVFREMLADILHESGKLDAALAEYRTGLQYAPGRDSLEKKFAKVTLEIADREREKELARDMLLNPQKYAPKERSPSIAFFSALIPGLGQFYNGEIVKSAVIFGGFLLFVTTYALFQRYPPGISNLHNLLYYTNPLVLITGLIFLVAYIYGVIDALVVAGKTIRKPEPKQAEPPV